MSRFENQISEIQSWMMGIKVTKETGKERSGEDVKRRGERKREKIYEGVKLRRRIIKRSFLDCKNIF